VKIKSRGPTLDIRSNDASRMRLLRIGTEACREREATAKKDRMDMRCSPGVRGRRLGSQADAGGNMPRSTVLVAAYAAVGISIALGGAQESVSAAPPST
jgi:hypothetical protein